RPSAANLQSPISSLQSPPPLTTTQQPEYTAYDQYTVRIFSTYRQYIRPPMDELERYLTTHAVPDGDGSSRLLREVAYERLKDAIRHADVQPGYPLSESHLSRLLGISRTPVREPLHQVVMEGLANIIPGTSVSETAHS